MRPTYAVVLTSKIHTRLKKKKRLYVCDGLETRYLITSLLLVTSTILVNAYDS